MTSLLVFSNRRWSFVYQRPEHLMSRLSRHYRIVYFEEPVHAAGVPRLDCIPQASNVDVLVPRTPLEDGSDWNDQIPFVEPLVVDYLRREGIDADCVAWFYTPLATPLLAGLNARTVVYDCSDDYDGAAPEMLQREAALLDIAGLVLAGGPALYESRRGRNPNLHCLPSSVDAAHFSPGHLDAESPQAQHAERAHAGIGRPRLGYFGVIDARIDLALVAALADAHATWQIVLAGPIVGLDPALLPRRPNLHWLGAQPYAALPYVLAGWDLCLLPYVINPATLRISPTKTLEYMAGEKPIVATPLHDVIALYGDTVRIGAATAGFVTACEQALAEGAAQRNRRIGEMLATVQRSSWDRTAATVHALIDAELRRVAAAAAPARAGADQHRSPDGFAPPLTPTGQMP